MATSSDVADVWRWRQMALKATPPDVGEQRRGMEERVGEVEATGGAAVGGTEINGRTSGDDEVSVEGRCIGGHGGAGMGW